MQLVKINPFGVRHSPQQLTWIPHSRDTERCWFSAKMLVNRRGMGEATLLPVCKPEFWFTTFSFCTSTHLVVALFVGKTCCSTEGNQALVCLHRLTRLTQQNSQVQLLFDLLEQKTLVSIVFSYF